MGLDTIIENLCIIQKQLFTTYLMRKNPHQNQPASVWFPISYSLGFMFRNRNILLWSVILFSLTVLFTWLGYILTVGFVDDLTGGFINAAPDTSTLWGWIKYGFWLAGKWLLLIISRIVAFYASFLLAYSLTSPGYVILSTATEKIHLGEHFDTEDAFTIKGVMIDLVEGIKIGLYGILVTIAALFVNFIPVFGQIAVLLLYSYYSALMFIDYPASRRRWTLGQKISWISDHSRISFRLGILPALVSMIPFLNVFLMAFLFPVMTIHTTLNFSTLVNSGNLAKRPKDMQA